MTLIKDGTGGGYAARVSSNNHLAVDSVSVAEITHISSVENKAYQFHFSRTLQAGATVETVAILTYTGNNKLQIESISLSREDAALIGGDQASVEIFTEAVYTSGGTAVTPVNLNVGSSTSPTATAYSGATTLVIDVTSAGSLIDVAFEHPTVLDFKGSLILNKGASIAIRGKSKDIGDIIHANITAFEVTEVI